MSPPQPAHCRTTAAAVCGAVPLPVPELLVTGFDPGNPDNGKVADVDDGADTATTGYPDPADACPLATKVVIVVVMGRLH